MTTPSRLLDEFGGVDFELPLDGAWFTGMTAYSEAAIVCRDAAGLRQTVRPAGALGRPHVLHRHDH